MDSHLTHVRELKTALAKAREENAVLREELEGLRAHFELALIAAMELRDTDETLELWDGWNLVLGAQREAKSREELIAKAQASGRRIWIVFDGHEENVEYFGKVRVSYTGTKGEHRADRFITDFVRMAAYLGLASKVRVRTYDKDFVKKIKKFL